MKISSPTPFLVACERGDLLTVRTYLNNPSFNPSLENNAGFLFALENRHEDIIMELAGDPRFNPIVRTDKILVADARHRARVLFESMFLRKAASAYVGMSDAQGEAIWSHIPKGFCYTSLANMESAQDLNERLLDAIKSDNIDCVNDCLASEMCDPNYNEWEAAVLAVSLGRTSTLFYLFNDTRFHTLEACRHLMPIACEKGSSEIVDLLLQEGTHSVEELDEALIIATESDDLEVVKCLLEHCDYSVKAVSKALAVACTNSRLNMMYLIDHPLCVPTYDNNAALLNAVDKCHVSVVSILLKHPAVQRSVSGDAVILSIKRKSLDAFLLLTQYFQPQENDDIALRCVDDLVDSNIEVAKAFLEWYGKTLSLDTSRVLWRCLLERGRPDVIEYMLPRLYVRPSILSIRVLCDNNRYDALNIVLAKAVNMEHNNSLLVDVCKKGFTEILCILLKDDRFNPSWNNNELLVTAVQLGNAVIVGILLQDFRVNPSCRNNKPIRVAAREGYTEVVKLLLNNYRVDPSACNNYAVRVAHGECWRCLIRSKRVLSKMSDAPGLLKKCDDGATIFPELVNARKSYSYTSGFLEYIGWEDYGFW